MKIVIDIPDGEYELDKWLAKNGMGSVTIRRILDGKLLPKGHGRLIDADALFSEYCEIAVEPYINAPTIIEADKE